MLAGGGQDGLRRREAVQARPLGDPEVRGECHAGEAGAGGDVQRLLLCAGVRGVRDPVHRSRGGGKKARRRAGAAARGGRRRRDLRRRGVAGRRVQRHAAPRARGAGAGDAGGLAGRGL